MTNTYADKAREIVDECVDRFTGEAYLDLEKKIADALRRAFSAGEESMRERAANELQPLRHTGSYTQESAWAAKLFPRVEKAIRSLPAGVDK
jgi:hypothetical protein